MMIGSRHSSTTPWSGNLATNATLLNAIILTRKKTVTPVKMYMIAYTDAHLSSWQQWIMWDTTKTSKEPSHTLLRIYFLGSEERGLSVSKFMLGATLGFPYNSVLKHGNHLSPGEHELLLGGLSVMFDCGRMPCSSSGYPCHTQTMPHSFSH